ncbi:MAG: methylenetetrahydrofolate reductase [NAD(P)H] [Verrucomicrobiae bacterium]|nr:methylenetetrahydrofolate reductase [NAD(P)H] [Verrucomicrobiae bacterium]NNJ43770.1 methylenetetrahydrofolate reductase [NAD(P)H] [Akkermansiaceae bacterium]
MHIRDIIKPHEPTFSFEFFPPKSSEAADTLFETIKQLSSRHPSFVSVTYGAGGSTRELTHDLVVRIKETTSTPPIPHLTCVDHTAEEITTTLERYASVGIGNILALRGDPPSDNGNYNRSNDAFPYAADLVRHIRQFNESGKHPDPRGFGIGVAAFPEGHPGTPNRLLEMDHLKAKVDEGADFICTQLFFDNHDFFDFRDRCRLAGISLPIIAGIMPITSAKGIKRMAELAAGAHFPAKLLRALKRAGDNQEAVQRVGIHHAAEQCAGLLNADVDGIHLYTLNQSRATQEVYASLGMG